MSNRKQQSGLDPFPSNARIRELYRERMGKELPELSAMNLPTLSKGSRLEMRVGKLSIETNGRATTVVDQASIAIGDTLKADRDGQTLTMMLGFAPRTKKNSTTLGIRQSPQYRLYRDMIVRVLEPVRRQLGLPLPEAEYNLAAIYYVDRYGERADLFGLHDGLADALQNAKVVTNDWQFRTSDGSRVVQKDPRPRVEIVITPIGDR